MATLDPSSGGGSAASPPPPRPIGAPPPARPTRDGPVLACVTFVISAAAATVSAIAVVAGAAAINAIAHGTRDPKELAAAASGFWPLLLTIVVSQLAMLVVVLGAAIVIGAPKRARLGLRSPQLGALRSIVVVAGGVFPLLAGLALAGVASQWLPSFDDGAAFTTLWTDTPLLPALLWIAVIGLLPGIVEELLFRGVIQRGFLLRMSPTASILITSLLFGLLHIAPPAILFAGTLGIWLGFVAWRTNSVILPIFTHMTINSGFNAVMMIGHRMEIDETRGNIAVLSLAAVAFVIFLWALWILRRR